MQRAAQVLARLVAAFLLAALCAVWGWRAGITYAARPPDYSRYEPAQLSWVAEGIMERISELEDELASVQRLQDEKLP